MLLSRVPKFKRAVLSDPIVNKNQFVSDVRAGCRDPTWRVNGNSTSIHLTSIQHELNDGLVTTLTLIAHGLNYPLLFLNYKSPIFTALRLRQMVLYCVYNCGWARDSSKYFNENILLYGAFFYGCFEVVLFELHIWFKWHNQCEPRINYFCCYLIYVHLTKSTIIVHFDWVTSLSRWATGNSQTEIKYRPVLRNNNCDFCSAEPSIYLNEIKLSVNNGTRP